MADPFQNEPILQFRPRTPHKPDTPPRWHLVAALILVWGAIAGMVSFALAHLFGWF